ncbi:phosphoribosylamine--glycine ligase [Wansuia hejianensis]|uniref:Phosphoribosylamine--glycine ligase n=1 Tax=Wansuia hejianensis TaxID=2763667 RepID=A0A926EU39_9FIRM|nr:phosphoribosylamine--glycine ligase [Wansuia hejianensis]MBC8589818.1 phosphoribosylamine--glycine ligase [Wansuia hejianensis]
MKILVIGSGGREHTLCWKISQSKKVNKIYCAPGNGGTKEVAENINIAANDIDGLLEFALKNKIDLTVVGPEEPLVLGIVDKFEDKGLKIFGPNKDCAQLEGSKEFSKKFMDKHGIPTAKYKSFTEYYDAKKALDEFSYPLVIKADGLCLGKGVFICNTREEAEDVLKNILKDRIFGVEGNKIVIEEYLDGVEASLLCFVTNGKIIPLESAKDYKKIYEGDKGPNTGGVGCYSPSPLFTSKLQEKINKSVLSKIIKGFEVDGLDFKGILFIGFMIVNNEPKVLEFNVRFGDPETEVLLPRLESDIVDLFIKTIDKSLQESDLLWSNKHCVTVILTSDGYPDKYSKGHEITIGELDDSIILFHNGTKYDEEKLVTNGGRVLSVTSLDKGLKQARENIYNNINKIDFIGSKYRVDIAKE